MDCRSTNPCRASRSNDPKHSDEILQNAPINVAMKRNPDRFPKDFCFQLTEEEILRSQFGTSSSWGGRRYLPYAYTEQGIIALAGVLRLGLADKMAVEISRVFVSMRFFLPRRKVIPQTDDFLRWAVVRRLRFPFFPL